MDTPLAANLINLGLGILNLFIVIAAFFAIWMNKQQAREDWQHSQQLALEERQHQGRPILVPVGNLSSLTQDGYANWEQLRQIDPLPPPSPPGTSVAGKEPVTQTITLQNMGEGVAFNVHCALYGPHDTVSDQYISWSNGPIQGKSSLQVVGSHGPIILDRQTKVDGTHFLYDASEPNYRIARLTATYRDLFEKKHVSIFDYIRLSQKQHRWMHVATKSGIDCDLEELDDQEQPLSQKRKPIN